MDAPVRRNEFHIVNGIASGTVLSVPPGRVTIGSGEEANVQLAFSGVSRNHASLMPVKQRIVIADSGSRNGTWVNGHRISGPTEIVDGDLLQFGAVQVRFRQRLPGQGSEGEDFEDRKGASGRSRNEREREGRNKSTMPKAAGSTKESVGAAVLFAVVVNVIGLLGNGATAFLTELTPTWSWFITPVAGLLIAVVTELVGHYRQAKTPEQAEPSGAPPRAQQRIPQQRIPQQRIPQQRIPQQHSRRLVSTLLVTVLLLGGGGWLLTAGVSTAVGYFSGNEDGTQRLEAPAVQEAQGVSVSVQSVLSTPHFTRVEILVRNQTDVSISMPLFQNCSLTAKDGTTLDADPFRSRWGTEIAAGGQRKGTINFEAQVPKEGGTFSLSFSTIFGSGFNIPRSITVTNIRLAPEAGYFAR